MPPKAAPSSSSQGQPTLFGFFKKAPAPVSSASKPAPAKALATPPLTGCTPSASSPAVRSSTAAGKDASRRAITPLVTSDAADAPMNSSSQSVPTKRLAPLESDDEEPAVKRPVKKKVTIVLDSDDEAVVSQPKPAAKAKTKPIIKGNPTDDSESEDYFNDDLDDFLVEDDTPLGKPPKKTAAPQKTPASKPMAKASGSGGGGGVASIKTKAEMAKQKEKDKKSSNESVFEFLVSPKDADGVPHSEEGHDPKSLFIPKSAWASFTPFEVQFWEIKKDHFDTVLFFQKGKFYELYESDALIGHQDFDLKLTDRVKMKMVGVPEASFDFWAAKFLAQGHKVGRVDQCETALGAELRNKDEKVSKGKKVAAAAPKGKGIVRRELKTVLTNGTIVDASMLTDDLGSHCVSIKEYTPNSTTPPTFGVCVLDAATAEFSLSSFSDDTCRTQIETLIRQLKPKEIIHEKGNLSVSTLRMLRNTLSIECTWTALKPGTQFLRPEDTVQELKKLFKKKGEAGMEVDGEEGDVPEAIVKMYDKPIAMTALGGMISYLNQLNLDVELVTAGNFNIYDPSSAGKALVLDGQTLAHIEVLQNSQGGIEGTLLQLLSRCVTPFGKRQFKLWLCSPLREAAAINDRLDAVQDLMGNAEFGKYFDTMVKGLPDIERLLSRIHAGTIKRKDFCKVVASFEKILKGINLLTSTATEFKSKGVSALLQSTPDLTELLSNITGMYEGDEALLPVEGQDEEFELVKQGVLDVEEALQDELKSYKKSLNCQEITFRDIGTKDIYQIQVPVKIKKLPKDWLLNSKTKEYQRFYSPEVTKLVQALKEARERKTAVVNNFAFRVYIAFDEDYKTWLHVIKIISNLDCLLSLSRASAALGEPSVRPEIVESDAAIVEFDELRHPCVLSATSDFIPNDVSLGGEAPQMILLTGPNMAGKSTMLRMTCAAIIMAQLGCFVPAAKARIAPIDAIYSRMGANDFIFANASTFKVEMDDTTKILKKATPKSLVILDELGRGTSTYDGMAIAFAVLHRLATHVGCIGFFATHFTSLAEDFTYHPQIRLCNMLTDLTDETRAVIFLYKLVSGSSPKSYGPHVASMAGLPTLLVERAIAISEQFEKSSRARERQMRASESLPLTSQADAAFLISLVKHGISEGADAGQLLRTLRVVRESALKSRVAVV